MNLRLTMPAAAEWIVLLLYGSFYVIMPVLIIVLYVKNRELKRRVSNLTKEKDELLTNTLPIK